MIRSTFGNARLSVSSKWAAYAQAPNVNDSAAALIIRNAIFIVWNPQNRPAIANHNGNFVSTNGS